MSNSGYILTKKKFTRKHILKYNMAIAFLALLLICCSPYIVNGQLSYDYYTKSCPNVETIVRNAMNSVAKTDPSVSAAILRLVFHDCQVGGCDGSVLLKIDDPQKQQEFDEPKNFGVRNRELIDQIKAQVDAACPQQVSCADILVLAARDGVAIAGGPEIKVPLGRKDTLTPHSRQEANLGLPRNNVNLTIALKVFASENGITEEEVVAILGAHTLGVTHCDGLLDRLYSNETVQLPPKEKVYVEYLKKTCPQDGKGQFTTKLNLDPTPNSFDNMYFVNVLNGQGLIRLDAEFGRHLDSRAIVEKFARDQNAFFQAFSSAFKKLTALKVLTGAAGEIRKTCSVLKS